MKTIIDFSKKLISFVPRISMMCILFFVWNNAHAISETITCSGAAGSYASGSVNAAGAKNDGNLVTLAGTGGNRGWASYDLSVIPIDATITSVTAEFTTFSSSSTSPNNIYGFIGDPSNMNGVTLYTDCASGVSFNTSSWGGSANQSKILNAIGLSFIQNFIQTYVGTKFNLGYVRTAPTAYNIYGYGAATPPKLIIEYTPCPNQTSGESYVTACDTYTWGGLFGNNATYNLSGNYTHTSINSSGCIHIETLHLTIIPIMAPSTSVTACDTYTWPCNNVPYTTSGMYNCTYLNTAGCAVTETLNLTIKNSTSHTSSATACDSYTWSANNATYISSGIYTQTSLNSDSCLNTAILDLTIYNSTTSTTNLTIPCDSGYLWSCNGTFYTNSGSYTCTYYNAMGCIHTEVLNLTFLYQNSSSSTSQTASNSYTWSCTGLAYTNSGVYTCTTINAYGCLHIDTLYLTILNFNSFTNPIDLGQAPCLNTPYINTQTNSILNNFTDSYAGGVLNQASPDIWYKFTLSKPATIRISTCGSGLNDTYIHLLNSTGLLGHIESNDDYLLPNSTICGNTPSPNHLKASLVYPLAAGTYYLVVEGYANAIGSITTTISTSFMDCYCISKANSTADEEIYKVTINQGNFFQGSTHPTYVNGCLPPVAPGPGSLINRYSNFNHTSIGAISTLLPNAIIPFEIQENECDGAIYYPFGTAIWIDYNRDGDFEDNDEKVFVENVVAMGPRNVTGSFQVPNYVTCGPTVMRITVAENYAGAALTPCLQYGYGETEDHLINIGSVPTYTTVSALCEYVLCGVTYTASGTYTCTHIGPTGCIETEIVDVTINYPAPVVENIDTCADSWTWAMNGATYTQSGTYVVTIPPCFDHILNLTLRPTPVITASANHPTNCEDKGSLSITVSNGTPNYSVSITPGTTYITASNLILINQNMGTYEITVTDAHGCTASTSVTILPPHESALHFKGNSSGLKDYATIPHNAANNLTTQNFTIEVWVKMDAVQEYGVTNPTILSKRTIGTAGTTGYRIFIDKISRKCRVQIGNSIYNIDAMAPLDTNCHHIVLTRNGINYKFYVDNSLKRSFNRLGNIPASTSKLYLGIDPVSGGSTHLKGYVDELRFWNRPNKQTLNNCAIKKPKPYLTAYYRFDEGIPNAPNPFQNFIFDMSGNNNTGNVINLQRSGTQSNWVPSCVHCCYPMMINYASACYSYTWPENGVTYTSSGIYTTATETLDLTITQSTTSTTTVSFTNAYTWPSNGATYTASGVYTAASTNSDGCDHIETLNLSITSGAFPLNVVEDQAISCFGNNDAVLQATASGTGTFAYTIANPSMPNVTNNSGLFINLEAGYHTVCATSNVAPFNTVCTVVFINEPDPLSVDVITDSVATCSGSNGVLIANISGGTNALQPYLTSWYNASNVLLNQSDPYALSVTGLTAGSYTLMVEDDHGCTQLTPIELVDGDCNTVIDLKLFIEGYMDGMGAMVPVLANQGMPSAINDCDSIMVELHDATAPFAVLHSTNAVLQQDGNATCVFASAINAGSYYLVVKHRNAIETWSANPISISSVTTMYDFTTAASQAYGNNQTQVSTGVFALYSGDVVKDNSESIDLVDIVDVESFINAFSFGYLAQDINGDGNVDILDNVTLEANVSNFIFAAHP